MELRNENQNAKKIPTLSQSRKEVRPLTYELNPALGFLR
jgi:hypothetical protein